jgi:poly-gamma-glutamate synthesis protein (capsule biosynthesis protein)
MVFNPVCKLVEVFGFWRYPSPIPKFRLRHRILNYYLNLMYWYYKSAKPIIRPEKDSKLQEYFVEKRRQIDRSLLPTGFYSENFVKISAVGDLMPAKGIENSKDKFYAKVEDLIFSANISIANLEFSWKSDNSGREWSRYKSGREWSRFKINATRKHYDAIKGHRRKQYTVFNTANNHITDWGMAAFNTTLDQLEADGFHFVGTNRSPQDQKKGLIFTSNGIKFGFVSATYDVRPFPQDKGYQVNFIPFHRFQQNADLSLLREQMSYCRSYDCDFIIVSLHWGREFEFFPRRFQVDIAHQLIENGADAIISHHNHVIQPYEIYQTQRDPHRKAIIFYGLGNLSSFWSAPHSALSLVANLDVAKGYVNRMPKTLIARVNVTPVLQMENSYKNIPYLQLDKLDDLHKSARGKSIRKYLNQSAQYADLVLGKRWRT